MNLNATIQPASIEDDSGETCVRCGVSFWAPGNELLLCDGPDCQAAYHLGCLRSLPQQQEQASLKDRLQQGCKPARLHNNTTKAQKT